MEISREQFCKVFDPDLVECMLDALEDHNGFLRTDNFVIWYDFDFQELYIVNKDSLLSEEAVVINWYKPTHIGRALHLSGIKDIKTLKYYRDMLAEDLYHG